MVFDKKAVRKNFAIFIGKHLEYCNILRPPILKNIFVRTARNVSKYGVISGTYFPVFGLNTERYSGITPVSHGIQSEYRKIRTRNSPLSGHFSRSDGYFSSDIRKCLFRRLFLESCFQNHPDSVILQKYQPVSNQSFKHKLTHIPF